MEFEGERTQGTLTLKSSPLSLYIHTFKKKQLLSLHDNILPCAMMLTWCLQTKARFVIVYRKIFRVQVCKEMTICRLQYYSLCTFTEASKLYKSNLLLVQQQVKIRLSDQHFPSVLG